MFYFFHIWLHSVTLCLGGFIALLGMEWLKKKKGNFSFSEYDQIVLLNLILINDDFLLFCWKAHNYNDNSCKALNLSQLLFFKIFILIRSDISLFLIGFNGCSINHQLLFQFLTCLHRRIITCWPLRSMPHLVYFSQDSLKFRFKILWQHCCLVSKYKFHGV